MCCLMEWHLVSLVDLEDTENSTMKNTIIPTLKQETLQKQLYSQL